MVGVGVFVLVGVFVGVVDFVGVTLGVFVFDGVNDMVGVIDGVIDIVGVIVGVGVGVVHWNSITTPANNSFLDTFSYIGVLFVEST